MLVCAQWRARRKSFPSFGLKLNFVLKKLLLESLRRSSASFLASNVNDEASKHKPGFNFSQCGYFWQTLLQRKFRNQLKLCLLLISAWLDYQSKTAEVNCLCEFFSSSNYISPISASKAPLNFSKTREI